MLKILKEYGYSLTGIDSDSSPKTETFLKKLSQPTIFLKKNDSNFGIEVEEDFQNNGEEIPKYKPDTALSIYINPLDKSDTISGIEKELKKAKHNNEFPTSIGCADKAKMAFYLSPDHISYSINKIMNVIKLNVDQYRNFYNNDYNAIAPCDPKMIKEMIEGIDKELLKPNLKKSEKSRLKNLKKEFKQNYRDQKEYIKKIKMTTGTNPKQRTQVSRAVGLYLWDCIHFEKLSQTDAVDGFLDLYEVDKYKKFLPPEYSPNINEVNDEMDIDDEMDIEDIKRILRKEVRLANACIEQCSVLNLSQVPKSR